MNTCYPNHEWLPVFPLRIFWDIDADSIDYQKHAIWVIQRVFERGNMDDIMELLVYYGNEEVAKVLKNTPGLKKGDMHLAIMMFHLKPNEFLC